MDTAYAADHAGAMDEVAFVVETLGTTRTEPRESILEIVIQINGRSLRDLARDVELPHAIAEGKPGLAGSYRGLSHWDIGSVEHFRGQPRASWFDDGDTVLLGCDCGTWGCWPLCTQVSVGAETVSWSGFRQGHRDWDLSALGPFEFARGQYDRALDELARALPVPDWDSLA